VDDDNRGAVLDVAANNGASIVDVNGASVTVMLAGTPGACDLLEKALESFADVELQRTGRVALPRLVQTANV
jgi:acetolactate synthase small subunit